jgi:TPR repeat protein
VGLVLGGVAMLAGVAWFIYAPLSDVVCGNANGSLDGHSEIYLRTCTRSCDRGDARSCLYLHDLQQPSSPKYNPLGDRVARGQNACDTGHACACADIGNLYGKTFDDMGPRTQMIDPGGRELAYLRRACDGGCARGCFSLAYRFDNRDDQIRLLDRACKGGDAMGCNRLAQTLPDTERDRANKAYVRACELGLVNGCWSAGTTDAKRMEVLGCRINPGACVQPAWDHFFRADADEIAEPELVSAMSSWCGRTERRASQACTCLGEMMVRGKGVPADPAGGNALIDRECAAGGEYACLSRALLDPDRVAGRAEVHRLCSKIVVSDNSSCGVKYGTDDFIVCHPDAVE